MSTFICIPPSVSVCLYVCVYDYVPVCSLTAAAFPFITNFVGMMIRRSKVGQSMAKVVDVALKIIADRKTDETMVGWWSNTLMSFHLQIVHLHACLSLQGTYATRIVCWSINTTNSNRYTNNRHHPYIGSTTVLSDIPHT